MRAKEKSAPEPTQRESEQRLARCRYGTAAEAYFTSMVIVLLVDPTLFAFPAYLAVN